MKDYSRLRDARRAGARILDTAEGVLVTLRRYRVDQAFVELMQTAKRYGVNVITLADAWVALAEDQRTKDVDEAAVAVAVAVWGNLFSANNQAATQPLKGLCADDA